MLLSSASVIGVGFALGLMHALDADHVMAVSTMSNARPGFWRALRFSSHWALGHAGVLMGCGLLLFGLGLSIPESLQHWAEAGVGVLLIVLGFLCFWRFHCERVRLKAHSHGDVVHTHWHVEGKGKRHGGEDTHADSNHAPVMVGMLHGLAGSAPALALVPVAADGEWATGLLYLGIFSLGVMLSMLFFATGFAALQKLLQEKYQAIFQWHRYAIAAFSVILGSFWLQQAI